MTKATFRRVDLAPSSRGLRVCCGGQVWKQTADVVVGEAEGSFLEVQA